MPSELSDSTIKKETDESGPKSALVALRVLEIDFLQLRATPTTKNELGTSQTYRIHLHLMWDKGSVVLYLLSR